MRLLALSVLVLFCTGALAQNKRMIGGQVVDLTPVLTYTGKAEGRPLKAWKEVTGTKVADGAGGWVVLASIDKGDPQRVLLRNPPSAGLLAFTLAKQKHQALMNRLAQLDTHDQQANLADAVATRQQLALENKTYNSTTEALQGNDRRTAALQQQSHAQLAKRANSAERSAIEQELAKLRMPGQDLTQEFQFKVWALAVNQQSGGLAVYDCGTPVR